MVKTLHFHCRGQGFDPWSGNEDPACHAVGQKKKTTKKTRLSIVLGHGGPAVDDSGFIIAAFFKEVWFTKHLHGSGSQC